MSEQNKGWYKGSLHNHTNLSDGDSSPEDVIKWYKRHDYHFMFITDHNQVTPVGGMSGKFNKDGEFLILPGEEITDVYPSAEGELPIHINALGINRSLSPCHGRDAVEVMQKNISAINDEGGIPMVNHPNYRWAITANDVLPVHSFSLFEFANCGAAVNNSGITSSDTEEMWDMLLTFGKRLWGVASDDSHHFTYFSPRHDNPGRGWVMVRCERLSPECIGGALVRGDFYSSTGVVVEEYEASPERLSIRVQQWGHTRYLIEFIGKGGIVLFSQQGTNAEYRISGRETYVRIRIKDSNNLKAWTQPVFIE
jgi:hypothetical protein